VYLRVWNRGTDATNVTATAYWSPPATLVTPGMWNLIGAAQFADVPPGRMVQVSDPGITWPEASIPAPGHYCFVATVGNADDPAPVPSAFASFDEFVAYIYAHNNISWRNFNVVPVPHPGRCEPFPEFVELRFLITGAWDAGHAFTLESTADLPDGSRLTIQVPEWLGRGLRPERADLDSDNIVDASAPEGRHRMVRLLLDPHGRHVLGQVDLPADTTAVSRLRVHIPAEPHKRAADIAIRQLYADREVGRITWRLVPER
jgi:serine protease